MSDEKGLGGMGVFPEFFGEAKELVRRYEFVEAVGEGKTGLACKIRSVDNEHLHFCVKTIRPSVTGGQRDSTKRTLKKEADILRPLHHRCLPQVFLSDFENQAPYYVCTYHPGVTFADFVGQGKHLPMRGVAVVVSSLIDTLQYLHQEARQHCDLHTGNLMISEEVVRDGILMIDFGSGHRGSASGSQTPNNGNRGFKDEKSLAKDREMVNRAEFDESFRKADFRALGGVFQKMASSFLKEASPASQEAYSQMAAGLKDGHLEDWKSVQMAYERFVEPFGAVSRNEDLFFSKTGRPERIVLPTSADVPVGTKILSIVNTVELQRLRGVRQLSFCDWFFPGAVHSRFEHVVGCFGKAVEAVEQMMGDSTFRGNISSTDVRGFYLASLLHDVGHYPFAHAVEQYARSRLHNDGDAINAVKHESRTARLLEGDLKDQIVELWGEDAFAESTRVLAGDAGMMSDLLDGAIDIDKLDYLTRDSHHCGVKHGAGLNVRLLLSSLRCSPGGERIGICPTGIPAVEGMVALQDQMLADVYWREEVRAVMSMFHAVLSYLVGDKRELLLQLVGELQECSNEEAASNVLVRRIQGMATGERQAQMEALAKSFNSPNYSQIYRPLMTYRLTDKKTTGRTSTVFSAIVAGEIAGQSRVPVEWDNVVRLRKSFQASLEEKGIMTTPQDVTVDVPYGKSKHPVTPVFFEGGGETPITEVSHLTEEAFLRPGLHASPVRVFVSPRVFNSIGRRIPSITTSAEEKFFSSEHELHPDR